MGYMGLSDYTDSDWAFDFYIDVEELLERGGEGLAAAFLKEVSRMSNGYNTPGPVNIALVVESGILNGLSENDQSGVRDALRKAAEWIGDSIRESETDNDPNRVYHVEAYRRMKGSLERWMERIPSNG